MARCTTAYLPFYGNHTGQPSVAVISNNNQTILFIAYMPLLMATSAVT